MIESTMRRIGLEIHGVTVNLSCNFDPLLDYLEDLLESDVRPAWEAPLLDVTGTWRADPAPADTPAFAREDSTPSFGPLVEHVPESEGFGKRMRLADDELVWFDTHRDKDLQLRFRRRSQETLFDVDYWYHPSVKKLARVPDYQQRKFFTLARYLVHFPIAWYLERTRGWSLVHASAVAAGDEALLIAGPGGAGKTTTCVGVMARAGVRLVTENLLFTDGQHVFPLREPIRLTDESLALLGEHGRGALVPCGHGGSKHKSLFRLPDGPDDRPLRPAALFIPRFAAHGFAVPIAPQVATEQLWATNRLTLELNDYYWYVAALDLLWPAAGNAARQLSALARLTAETPCYALGIDRAAGVDAVVDRVLDCVGWSLPAGGRRLS
ncbi:MAG: hypothetical protein DMF90_17115 [Acidobacteria bacterium]|nr:MAG: hypothetical protein DMF90_17115 [Acidobacteriota bacterium]